MKKELILCSCFIILSAVSCNKNESGNKGVVKADTSEQAVLTDDGTADSTVTYNTDVNGKKSIKTDYVYKATDGSLVKVIYKYDSDDRTMTITNKNKTFVLEKYEAKTYETIYRKADMTATVKGDSLIIHQGENSIELVKTKI